jgi:uncharacterized repeat protein (TIGR01451 family)
MSNHQRICIWLVCTLIAQAFFSFVGPPTALASPEGSPQPRMSEPSLARYLRPIPVRQPSDAALDTLARNELGIDSRSSSPVPLADSINSPPRVPKPQVLRNGMPTLTVEIISSPWALLDHNKPGDPANPHVFVVQAVITNNHPITPVNDLIVTLHYKGEDPRDNWTLLSGEDPERTKEQLGPGSGFHAYWFATYPTDTIGADLQYTVTAYASNAYTVTTSDNAYGELSPGITVATRAYQSTGNSGVAQTSADVVVGVAFTVSVGYELGTNPQALTFSPVGNLDFNPGAYRLYTSTVRIYNEAETDELSATNRLYFPTMPGFAEYAEATYTFIAQRPGNTQLCPYTAVDYKSTDKYDQFYCSDIHGTSVPISGTLSISVTKRVSRDLARQGQSLAYTINYTNSGTLPLQYAWIWDRIDIANSSIITHTTGADPDETKLDQGLVAWYLNDVAPGESDVLTLTVRLDGGGGDIADETSVVNHGFFGITQDSLPKTAALTETAETTIEAPTISLSKTDGLVEIEAGETLTYLLTVTNTGSIAATGMVITDVLPLSVTLGTALPPGYTQVDERTLVWTVASLESDATFAITIPVTVGITVPNGSILTNGMVVEYGNGAGHTYGTKTATDTTTVQAPVLSINKTDFPDPILVVPGNRLTYTLHYTNSGPVPTTVLITDVVPISTTYKICSRGDSCGSTGLTGGSVVTWTGTILAGRSETVTFSVEVITDAVETDDLITNSAYGIKSDQTGVDLGPPVTTRVNKRAAFVHVYTFWDKNGNGISDTLDVSLSSVPVALEGIGIGRLAGTTSITGFHQFRVERQVAISVTAALTSTPSTAYFRTTPGTVFTDVVLGRTTAVYFGYAPDTSTFGVLYGTAFEDANHDSNQDIGENGLAGVTITSTLALASPATRTTNGFGQYTFSYTVDSQAVTITAEKLDSYVHTTPGEVYTSTAVPGSRGSIDFGYFQGIRVTGRVFDDVNVNGADDGEAGLQDAGVDADSASFQTETDGAYVLYVAVHDSNPILVVERDPDNYVSTNAVPGDGMSRVDANILSIDSPESGRAYSGGFGDVQASDVITISGQVWEDNGTCSGCFANGVLDPGEGGLAGAVVSLSSRLGGGLTQTTSLPDGAFLLYALPNEVITVTETNPLGYVSTNAIPGNDATKLDHDTLVVRPLGDGLTSQDNLFGDALITATATITGTVFDDADENGVFESATGEVGIPGVIVTLEISGSTSITTSTDANGRYQFAVAPGTNVRITSGEPIDYYLNPPYPTTLDSVIVRPPSVGVYPDNNFGWSDDVDVAVIAGIVFDDVDSDGEQDFEEGGLAGAVITLTNGGAPITATTSGSGLITGTFRFTVTRPATPPFIYLLEENNPPGYRSTTPDRVPVSVISGTHWVSFGDTNNSNTASVYGIVYDDLNSNGLHEPDEPGIGGVIVSVGALTATTKTYGQFTYGFTLRLPGAYRVVEHDPPGYHSTTPNTITVWAERGESYMVNFGDTQATTHSVVMGIVFEDTDGNGEQGPAELGIKGVTVTLYTSSGISNTTTGDYGDYTLRTPAVGYVQVVETDPITYHSTTPNAVAIFIDFAGRTYVVNFGDSSNAYLSSVFGTVFDDQNVSGVRDPTEPPLEGFTVTITGTFDTAPDPYVTNGWGQYTFPIEITGTYTITERDLAGYISTNAIPGHPAVTKLDNNTLRAVFDNLGTDLGDNLFGDVLASQAITISGYVWDDNGAGGGVASDGVWDLQEPGLAGATVRLDSGMTQTTGVDGAFVLYAPPGQAITVTEANPPGYLSTGSIAGTNAVEVDDDTLRVSSLAGGAASANNRFGDVLPADLAIFKSAAPEPAVAGATLTYTVIYTNNGPSFAQGITITDTLPAEVTFGGVVSLPPMWSGPIYDAGPPATLSWSAPYTLAAGPPDTLVFTVTVDPDVPNGTVITNSVVISSNTPDLFPTNDAHDEGTRVATVADLVVDKEDEPSSLDAGERLTYTLVVRSDGPSDAQSVVVSDTLPAQVTLFSVDPITDSQAGRTLTWNAGLLLSGASRTYTVVVDVNSGVRGWITNTATVTSTTFDPVAPNVHAEPTYIGTATDLAISKSADPRPATAGGALTYTLQVDNNGPSDAQNVVISDTLPAEVAVVSVDPITDSQAGRTLTWEPGTLTNGESRVYTVVVEVDSDLSGAITNRARATSTITESEPSDNLAVETTPIQTRADLIVSKSSDPAVTVIAGERLTYTLDYVNNGPSDAQNVVVSDTLPVGVRVLSVNPVTDTQSGRTLTWVMNTVADGGSGSIVVLVAVDSDVAGSITNTAEISSDTQDDVPGNNRAVESIQVTTRADLAIVKSDDPDPVAAGAILTYTLVYTNYGPSDAQDVLIVDSLPPEVTFGGATDDPGTVVLPDLTWYVPTLAAGDSDAIVLTVTVRPDGGDMITNNVSISSSSSDPDTGNNDAEEGTQVGTTDLATIYGYVFDDLNGDGERQAGELGIGGVTITLDGGPTATTDGSGLYVFITPVSGTHTVVETDPPGYRSTMPNTVVVNLRWGESKRVDFGDVLASTADFSSIYGTVFDDLDGDGTWDDGESGIEGVTITLNGQLSTTTGVYGRYSFTTTVEAVHTVVETDLPGYFSTTPNERHVDVALGESYEVNFGDAPNTSAFATIFGTVFDDVDGDGTWDADELGIQDVLITLDGGTTVTTSQYGGYTFLVTTPGFHTAVETDPLGYSSTTPNEVPVDVSLGNGYQVDFGDRLGQPTVCVVDGYEEDDDVGQARHIGIGQSQAHNFCDDATDWVTFAAEAGEVYTITTLSWGQRADTVLDLFDTDGHTLLAGNDDYEGTTDFSSRLLWKAPADGVYYVRVTNRAGLTELDTEYDLWIRQQKPFPVYLPLVVRNYPTYHLYLPLVLRNHQVPVVTRHETGPQQGALYPTGIISHTCPDAYELDDTWQTAGAIEVGVPQIHSFDSDPLRYIADKDFVWFDIVDGTTITLTTAQVTDTQTALLPGMIRLELYDQYGAALDRAGTGYLVWEDGPAGHYVLGVSPLTTTFGCTDTVGYSLLLETDISTEEEIFIYLPLVTRGS